MNKLTIEGPETSYEGLIYASSTGKMSSGCCRDTDETRFKKLRCEKSSETWFCEVELPHKYNDLDEPLFHLFDCHQNYVAAFPSYKKLKEYIELQSNS